MLVCVERARRAAEDLQRELRREQCALERVLDERRAGVPVSRIVERCRADSVPDSLTDPTIRFGEAIHDYRAALIRCLVDEEGWTLTRAAEATGHARQLVSRLYHSARLTHDGMTDAPTLPGP